MKKILFLALLFSLTGYKDANAEEWTLCPGLVFESPSSLVFSKTEIELLCNSKGPEAWSDIPNSQKKRFLASFLQERGYFYPKFTELSRNRLSVVTGSLARVSQIKLSGNTANVDISRNWQIKGRPLNPGVLDDLEKWLLKEYGLLGYPCASLSLEAFPKRGIILAKISSGPRAKINEVESEGIIGLRRDLERRYDPFVIGQVYDSLKIELSSTRIVAADVVLNSNFSTKCQGDAVVLTQSILAGEPRLVTFGVGFDTEEYGIVEGSWKNARVSQDASALSVNTHISYLKQNLGTRLDWYYAPMLPRHFLRSELVFQRENERHSDVRKTELISGPLWKKDTESYSFDIWPALSYAHNFLARGEGKVSTDSLSLSLAVGGRSHDYEFFAADPRSGWDAGLYTSQTSKDLGSDYSFSKYQLASTKLFNLFQLDPPLWIVGLRTEISTITLGEGTSDKSLPTHMKLRLGGSDNLRGFGRQSIPSNGALTTAYLGTELRLSNVIPFGLQPLIFLDSAKFGYQTIDLEQATFLSPGVGVHWRSPIGTFRGTVAKAIEVSSSAFRYSDQSYHAYFSFGEQF